MENNNSSRRKLIAIAAAVGIFAAGYGTATVSNRIDYGNVPASTIKNLNKIEKLISKNYYTDYDKDALYRYAEEFMVYGLDDPYSYYLDEKSIEEYDEDIMGNYVGIGVTLTPGDNGEIRILAPFEGSPALDAGIKANDILHKVDGKEYMYDNVDEAVSKIRGKSGDKVKLEIIRGTETLSFEVEKREIEVASVTSKKLESNIVYLKVSRFDITTADDLKDELKKYEINDKTGIVLDLRDNPGGVVISALEIADMFISEGILLTEKYKNAEDVITNSTKDALKVKYPVVILANKYSASASEILTGALKDNGVAVLVGETTYGKGILNQKFNIDDKSSLVLSIGEYTTPSGESIHEKGITPDYEVLLPENLQLKLSSDLTSEEDIQLKKAVELITRGDIK